MLPQVDSDVEDAVKLLPTAFPNLTSLRLGADASDGELQLVSSVLPNLEFLKLYNCGAISDAGAEHLARLSALTRLELAGASQVTDQGLSSFTSLTSLQALDARGTGITGVGLAQLARLPALRSLNVTGCAGLTDAQLIENLSGKSSVAAEAAMHALADRTADGMERCTEVLAAGALGGGVVALLGGGGTRAAQDHAAVAIAWIAAAGREHCAAIVESGALEHGLLALLAGSGSPAAQEDAAVALAHIAASKEEARSAIADAGALPTLVQLLRHQSAGVAESAAKALNSLMQLTLPAGDNDSRRRAIVAAGCVPSLLALLVHPCDGTAEAAKAALLTISFSGVIDDVITPDTVPDLMTMAAFHESTAAALRAATLVQQLAYRSGYCDALVACGSLPWLSELLQHSSDEIVRSAIVTLGRIASRSVGCRTAVVEAGCLPPLVALLSSQQLDVANRAAATLQLMAGASDALGDAHREAIVVAGCLPRLKALLLQPETVFCATPVIFTLASGANPDINGLPAAYSSAVTGTNATRDAIVAAGCLPDLAALLSKIEDEENPYDGESPCECAAATLKILAASSQAYRDALVASGGLPLLAAALSHAYEFVAWGAASALCDLANNGHRAAVVAAVQQPVVTILRSSQDAALRQAADDLFLVLVED